VSLRLILAGTLALVAGLFVVAVSGAAPGTDASVTQFDQCANGGPPSVSTGCPDNWINGILNANNSHYAEDDVTPQRVVLDLPKNGPMTGRTVEISYLTRKGGVHAYDSLATWNHTQTSADRCANLPAADCVGGSPSTLAIPSDPTVVADANGAGSATSSHQLSGQVFTLYGGTLTAASSYTHDDPSGTSDEYAHITLTYSVPSTADGAKVMLLFGGHIASSLGPRGWGAGVGAGSISGGPYHVRITAADGASVGNRDNQIMSTAILAPANIVIRKNAVGGDDTFGYTSTGGLSPASFSITTSGGTGSYSYTSISPGSYTVTESAPPAGWDFTSLQCVDEDNGSSASGQTANIDLDPGETVTCTYTNTKRGKIIVEKQTLPDGDPQLFTFSRSYGADFQLSDGQTNDSGFTLTPGTYSVSETVPAGWDQTGATCSDGSSPGSIGLSAGETVTCTFTNTKRGALVVYKQVVNDNGGTALASGWTMNVSGPTSLSFAGSAAGVSNPVLPGAYSVGESGGPSGYAGPSYPTNGLPAGVSQNDCNASGSVTVGPGETKRCVLRNDDQPATLIVKKVVVNDSGGTKGAADFSFQVNGGAAQAFEADGQNDLTVNAGTYNVTEPAVAGYTTTYDNCSGIELGIGQTATCTITNDDQAGTLIVKKVVVNDSGGTKQAQDFSFSVNGGAAQAFEADGQNDLTVNAGTYDVTEPAVEGYATSYDNCSDVVVPNGGSATCTITNDDEPATLIVKKVVVNDNGGTRIVSDFSFRVNGGEPQSFEGDGQNDLTVNAGTYDVTEPEVDGYSTTYDNCSDLVIPNGGSETCTITNDDDPAELIIRKVVVNDNGGTKGAADFSFQVNGGAAQAFEADGQNDLIVNAGTYNVSEPAVAGYTTTYQGCANIVLPIGGSATCTITNNDVPRGQGSISVSKSADPTTLKEPGGPVTFSVTITNTSVDVDVTIENVVDDKFGDLDDSGGNGCFDVPINLAPGGKANCTFQKSITGPGGTSHVNVVTASGHDENGHALQASDDARVDITERLIDLVIVKDATSPTPLNGIVNYTLTVTNRGPDTATNVQVADPAPAGITYLTASPSQGTCSLSASLVTCSLGTIAAGQTVSIAVTARATAVGSHTNTATVTGGGGKETNPADNVDSAVTVVPAPLKPPVKPEKPEPEFCLALTVSPKMIKADGKADKVSVTVTAGTKRVKGVKVVVSGGGVQKTGRTNAKGVAVLKINPKKPGIITVTVLETNQKLCGPKRIGVVGVFLPPLTG
jgi:uncharacterized repeat protein (TIGR01451 family)